MLPESSKLLLDIRRALEDIEAFTAGLDLEAYKGDAKCRAAVERKFEVAGEACVRLRERFPEIYVLPTAAALRLLKRRLCYYTVGSAGMAGSDLRSPCFANLWAKRSRPSLSPSAFFLFSRK